MTTTSRTSRITTFATVIAFVGIAAVGGMSPASAVEDAPIGSILVVAPHPDDDVITSAGITFNRAEVTIAFMTNSDTDPVGPEVRQDEAVAAQLILGQAEPNLRFLGYPDAHLVDVWNTPTGAFNANGRTETFASHGLGGTDWHDYRMGPGEQHADYNKGEMVADMVALIDDIRPAHIFTTSEFDAHTDHATTFKVIEEAVATVTASDPSYGTVVHETIVWHPDSSLWSSWPQDRNAAVEIAHDAPMGASPSIETASGGTLAWNEREQFYIPSAWTTDTDGNPKALAIDAHAGQGGLGGFIGRFIHRDEIFWADYINYPAVSISDATATEGGSATFTISRTGAHNVATSVTATTSNGTATAPGDYTSRSDVVTLAAGQASATFIVDTTEDSASEPAESFTVTLSGPSEETAIADGTGIGTINDDDSAGIAIDELGGLALDESGGSDTYRVSLTTQPTAPVTVTVTPNSQLTADRGSLSFTTGNWSAPQTITVTAVDDTIAETHPHSGSISHTATSPDPAYNSLGPAYATATIVENSSIAGPTTAATGSSLLFTADSGADSYAWVVTSNGSQVATATTPTLSFTPAAGGDYAVNVVTTVGGAFTPSTRNLKVLGDIAASTFVNDIIWLADNGITAGCNPPANDQFCPNKKVTRGQMAAFLVRFLGLTDDGGGNTFTDDNGSVFENDIAKLAAAGITAGCNPPANDQFCPNKNVTRGQMAAFLARALGLTDDGGGNTFTDDNGSVFENDIAKLAAAGITAGCNPPANDQFCPNSNVTRGQMAAFLRRADGLS